MKKNENLLIDMMETYAFPPAAAREAPPSDDAKDAKKEHKESKEKSLYCATPQDFNAKVRAVLPARGARFKDDHLHTCMYIERSKNANIVAYTPKYKNVTDEGTRLQQKQAEDVKGQSSLSDADKKKLYEKLTKEVKTSEGKVVASGPSSSAAAGGVASPTRHETLVQDTKDPMHCYWIKLEPEHVERRRGRGETEDVCELNFLENKMAYGCSVQPLTSRSNSPTKEKGKATTTTTTSTGAAAGAATRSSSHLSSKCQTFLKELNKQLVEKYKKVKPTDKKLKERYTKLSDAEEAAARAWCRYFQPSFAKYVALSSWNIVLLHLPPLTSFEEAKAVEEVLAGQKKAAAATTTTTTTTATTHKDPAAAAAAAKPTTVVKKKPESSNSTSTTAKDEEEGKEKKKKEKEKQDEAVAKAAAVSSETVPVMLAYIDHKLSIVKKVFVASIEPKHFYQLPTVEYIEAYGTCLETGEPTYERLGKTKK